MPTVMLNDRDAFSIHRYEKAVRQLSPEADPVYLIGSKRCERWVKNVRRAGLHELKGLLRAYGRSGPWRTTPRINTSKPSEGQGLWACGCTSDIGHFADSVAKDGQFAVENGMG